MNLSRLTHLALRLNAKPQNLTRVTSSFHLNHPKNTQKRAISIVETKTLPKDGLVKRIVKKIPFLNVDRSRLMTAGYLLYENVADKINYIEFFEELDLPDTFYSWFVVTELHIWMISVRAMAEGDDGKLVRNFMLEALWNDVSQRVKKLGGDMNPAAAREQILQLSEQLQAALIAYDEGLLSDDTILAGALWRRFYQQKDVEPLYLDILVKYIRKQMRLLDHLSTDHLLETKKLNWTSLKL